MPILFSILIVLLVLALFLAAFMVFRTLVYGRLPGPAPETIIDDPIDGQLVAEHLSNAIRCQTISESNHAQINYAAFETLHAELMRMYPRTHAALRQERINGYSSLYMWPGKNGDLEPVMLCGHIDVVPADSATLQEWTHPPFRGDVDEGAVWGRGALDMKSTVIAIFEAVEALLKSGYQPERTVYLAIGHDEEIGGLEGARCIAQRLLERGEHLAAVFDEGGAIMDGGVPGVHVPVAMVGVGEKGYASLELVVEGRAGHSSMPPPHTAIGVLARALARLEQRPMRARTALARLMFQYMGPFLPFGTRMALANYWLLGGAVQRRLEATAATNAIVRTTAAITMIDGGVKDNILPARVKAVVNYRILPGDTVKDVLEHAQKVAADEAVQVQLPEGASWEPSPISPVDSIEYEEFSTIIRQVFPEVIVAPYLVAGATDSRHYLPLTNNVYRFSPFSLDPALLKTIHGIDERISIESLARMVQFYLLLIRDWTEGEE